MWLLLHSAKINQNVFPLLEKHSLKLLISNSLTLTQAKLTLSNIDFKLKCNRSTRICEVRFLGSKGSEWTDTRTDRQKAKCMILELFFFILLQVHKHLIVLITTNLVEVKISCNILCVFLAYFRLFQRLGRGLGLALQGIDKSIQALEILRVSGTGCYYKTFDLLLHHEKRLNIHGRKQKSGSAHVLRLCHFVVLYSGILNKN